MTDDVPTWPTIESVKAELLERELAGRISRHYKHAWSQADAAQRFADSKGLALAEDAKRTWRRR